MKNYTITVNGNTYDVVVEEKSGNASPAQAPVAKAAAPAPAPVKKPAASANAVISPLAGKVLSFKVKPGTQVKKGQPIIVLEAMKMENDIVAPSDGVVAEFCVTEGASVEAGTLLANMQ